MLVDGHLSDDEIIFLKSWLEENDEIAHTWPGEVLYRRINKVLADNVIDEDERSYLKKTLEELIGGSLQETGATSGIATSLPVQEIENIEFERRKFCFSGTFLYGTRAACHRVTEQAGGEPANNITRKLDYLVIGTMSTRSWANTSFGRKIEKAMEFQKQGAPLTIIDEQSWVRYLPSD
ncbi:MAG: BRCT domain-containing protein [Planctomycetes bacterium]|nr:BRCT domain-containing protein [Planctomycetota bacterium]